MTVIPFLLGAAVMFFGVLTGAAFSTNRNKRDQSQDNL